MPSALRRGIVALVAVVIAPVAARAADIPVIRVFPPECAEAPVSVDDFVDALRVELAGRQPHCCVVGPGGEPATDALKVTLVIEPCEAATQHVDVQVDVTATQRTITRQVSLADLPPEARPRALALAVAELIRSAGESTATGSVAAAGACSAPPRPSAACCWPATWPARSAATSRSTPRCGACASASCCRAAAGRSSLDAGAATSRNEVSLGDLRILLASATLFAGPRFVLGPVIASVGPAGTLGWARIEGHSSMPGVVAGDGSGLVSTFGLRAAAEGPASSAIRLLAYVEGGHHRPQARRRRQQRARGRRLRALFHARPRRPSSAQLATRLKNNREEQRTEPEDPALFLSSSL